MKIFPLLLATVHTVKSKGKILQTFVAFSEYMNFMYDKEEPPCLQYLIQIFGMAQHYPMPQLMQHCVSLCPIVFLGT